MERDTETLAVLESLDVGKPIKDALARRHPAARSARCATTPKRSTRSTARSVRETRDRFSFAVHEPLGVIGAIVPWNFPLHMAMWKVAPALAMGNSVVLKPAEQSPLTALKLGELALEAGVPPGVLNVVPGFGAAAGKALALHMDVDMIAFTGSGAVGRLLMQYSGQSNLKRVSLELGGKSPQIVFADCPDLNAAACMPPGASSSIRARSARRRRGCSCRGRSPTNSSTSCSRSPSASCRAIRSSPRPASAPWCRPSRCRRRCATSRRATREGGALRLGGKRTRVESGGFYRRADRVRPGDAGATLAREEVFGPVLAVTTLQGGRDDAIRIANDTVYGLAAGLWTRDISLAHRAAREINAGLVWINGWDTCDITMPFGGFKQSGFGRDRSLHALHKYADLKSVSITLR